MDRDIPQEERESRSDAGGKSRSPAKPTGRSPRENEPHDATVARPNPQELGQADRSRLRSPHKPLTPGGRAYPLSDAERATMAEIGRFRTVGLEDLRRYRYRNDRAAMDQDLQKLNSRGLVRVRTLWLGKDKERLSVIALTKPGKRLLEDEATPVGVIYAGLVKPREVKHDAAIYRMYQAEAARIEREGGHIRRVILDYELKTNLYSQLGKAQGRPAPEYARRQAELAAENGLKIVRGHVQLPDLRIEYERQNGERATADLELATPHYRSGQLAAKAEAGFKFYASADAAERLGAVFEEREITAEILRL